MFEAPQRVKVGVVQAAPAFLDVERSTGIACEMIEEAGHLGVSVLGFPEGFIPTHPLWYHFLPASHHASLSFARRLFHNSVEIPGPHVDRLSAAAARSGVNVIVGVCERLPGTDGTLFNTQVFISSSGELVAKRRKITPTLGERLVHALGSGEGLVVLSTPAGRISGLICGENSNPLAIATLAAGGTQIHIGSWPSHFGKSQHRPIDLIPMVSQGIAYTLGAYVLAAAATVSESMVEELAQLPGDADFLRDPTNFGGSTIVRPNGSILAGPWPGTQEGVLVAEIDLEACIAAKYAHDYAGHYNRPDIFNLRVNRDSPSLVTDKRNSLPASILRDDSELLPNDPAQDGPLT